MLCLPSRRTMLLIAVSGALMARQGIASDRTEKWVGTWSTALCPEAKAPATLTSEGMTIRNIVHISAGGNSVRFKFSNEFGIDPLTLGDAGFAADPDGPEVTDKIRSITFGGKTSVTIPQGAVVVSDPVPMQVKALTTLAIDIFLPKQPLRSWTRHPLALQTNFIVPGNHVATSSLAGGVPVSSSFFLKAVDVKCTGRCATIVALGDSITDGLGSTQGANHRWPDVLAARLAADPRTSGIGIVNEGISGNRLLHEGAGPSVLARLDRDVLTQSGVKFIVLLEGINDIGVATRAKDPADPVSLEDLEWSIRQIVERAHAAGVMVFGATLTPAGRRADDAEEMRLKLNEWMRTGGGTDGVIDFDAALRDPQQPRKILQEADSGDSLHPSDKGYKRMGDAIDLKVFKTVVAR